VFGGMLAATILTLVFVPVFYALIERWREGRPGAVTHEPADTNKRGGTPPSGPLPHPGTAD